MKVHKYMYITQKAVKILRIILLTKTETALS